MHAYCLHSGFETTMSTISTTELAQEHSLLQLGTSIAISLLGLPTLLTDTLLFARHSPLSRVGCDQHHNHARLQSWSHIQVMMAFGMSDVIDLEKLSKGDSIYLGEDKDGLLHFRECNIEDEGTKRRLSLTEVVALALTERCCRSGRGKVRQPLLPQRLII